MKETIGQRVLAAVLSYQLGISMDRARKLYVIGREIHPSWEAVGELLLGNMDSSANGSALPELTPAVSGKDGGAGAQDDHS